MYAIGVDSGTQGTKVLITNFSGDVLGRGSAPHVSIEGLNPGESEQAPHVWLTALEKALADALKEARIDAGKVVCLGISGQQHGFVPLDKNGHPIRPAKLWNDTESAAPGASVTGPPVTTVSGSSMPIPVSVTLPVLVKR